MSAENSSQPLSRMTLDQASEHLVHILRVCDPDVLRGSVDELMWDAQEYAEWISADAVTRQFTCKELAESSFRYGTASVDTPVEPSQLLGFFDSPKFQKLQRTVCERVVGADVRSLVFFGQGVKLAVANRQRQSARRTS